MCIYVLYLFLNNVDILVLTIYIKIYNINLCQARTTSIPTYIIHRCIAMCYVFSLVDYSQYYKLVSEYMDYFQNIQCQTYSVISGHTAPCRTRPLWFWLACRPLICLDWRDSTSVPDCAPQRSLASNGLSSRKKSHDRRLAGKMACHPEGGLDAPRHP